MSLFVVTRDGVGRSEPMSHNECFAFILRHQGQSVDWAMKYEGWDIQPAKKTVDISPVAGSPSRSDC